MPKSLHAWIRVITEIFELSNGSKIGKMRMRKKKEKKREKEKRRKEKKREGEKMKIKKHLCRICGRVTWYIFRERERREEGLFYRVFLLTCHKFNCSHSEQLDLKCPDFGTVSS